MHLSVPSIGFVYVFVCPKLSPHLRGSQVFAHLTLFLCVILHTMWPAVAIHLALRYVVLVCHKYDVCNKFIGSVYVGGYGGLSESGLVSSVNCVQLAFLSW